ncbi:MAG: hypothetical protein ACM3JI_02550 [Anaerolineae bacterium]
MKKIAFLLGILFVSESLQALYFGNPAEPQMIEEGFFLSKENFASVKASYQGDFIFDRKLRAHDGARGRIDNFKALMQQGVLILNFQDRYEVYGSLGAMHVELSHRPHFDGRRRQYESNDHLTWGVGGKVIIFQWNNTLLGADAKFQYANPHMKWNAVNGEAFTTGSELTYKEFQGGLAVSHHVDIFTPYFALKYSEVRAKMRHIRSNTLPRHHFKMRSRDYVGIALGCSLSTGKLFDLNVEVTLIDEQALTLAGDIKF